MKAKVASIPLLVWRSRGRENMYDMDEKGFMLGCLKRITPQLQQG
jgi:hypothetical protein